MLHLGTAGGRVIRPLASSDRVALSLMAFCFIHAADLHLDTPFEGVAGMSGDVAERLRDASLEAFDGVVRLAVDRRAVFVLLAGDLYDGAERGVRAQLRFLRGLEVLSAAGIPVFVVCLLYTSDAADDLLCVDLGGRRI